MPPVVELVEPDGDVELMLPDGDGEVVLRPVPLELVAPPLLTEPGAPAPEGVLLIEPDAPVPVVGDADGLPETPAACIACWLQRSKSARDNVPWPMTAAGSRTATMAAVDPMIFAIPVISNLLELELEVPAMLAAGFKIIATTEG